jgi:hypothetical protein
MVKNPVLRGRGRRMELREEEREVGWRRGWGEREVEECTVGERLFRRDTS